MGVWRHDDCVCVCVGLRCVVVWVMWSGVNASVDAKGGGSMGLCVCVW